MPVARLSRSILGRRGDSSRPRVALGRGGAAYRIRPGEMYQADGDAFFPGERRREGSRPH